MKKYHLARRAGSTRPLLRNPHYYPGGFPPAGFCKERRERTAVLSRRQSGDSVVFSDKLLFFRNDQTITAVLPLVDNAGSGIVRIVENEELMPQKIHLQNRFLSYHRLLREGLHTDDFFILCCNVVKRLLRVRIEISIPQALRKPGLVLPDLAFNVGAGFVQRVPEAFRPHFTAEERAARGNGNFNVLLIVLAAERNGGISLRREKFIEFSKFFLNQKLHFVIHIHLSADYGNLHTHTPCLSCLLSPFSGHFQYSTL